MGPLRAAVLSEGRVPSTPGSHLLLGGGLYISVKATEWVFQKSNSEGVARNVLLAIAAHCDSDGWCWPSFDLIARYAKASRGSVSKALAELEALGELEIERSAGRVSNRYFLPKFASTVLNSFQNTPNSSPTVSSDSVSDTKETELAPLIKNKNNKTEEEPGEVFKCLKRIFRQNTGKGLKSIGRYGEEFRYLVEKKTGDVVLEAFKLWLLENKEFAKECDWPMAAFMKNVNEKIEAYEDKVAGEQDEEEEEGLPRLKPEGI